MDKKICVYLGILTPTQETSGSHRQGTISITYEELVQHLGDPHFDGDKTTAEWAFVNQDGAFFTIYDYKEYSTPLGQYDWHIGGFGSEALNAVKALFPKHQVEA